MTRPPGQFYHGIEFEVSELRPGEVPEKPDATMFVKGQELNVTRYTMRLSQEFSCFVSANEYVLLKYNLTCLHDMCVSVHRGWQRDFRGDVKNGENIPCWFIHSNGTGLLDGTFTDYIVSGLFKTV